MGDKPNSAFSYEGTEISIDGDGNFTAELGGEIVRKPTLKALKAYLRENKRDTFQPFDALFTSHSNVWSFREEPRRIRIIGFERTKNRSRGPLHTFKTDAPPSRYYHVAPSEVIADTPENAKVISEILRLTEEQERIHSEYSDKISILRHELKIISVTDFVKEI